MTTREIKILAEQKRKEQMTIKRLKKELNMQNKDIAKLFGLSLSAYANSSAKNRYEGALVEFYKIVNNNLSRSS